MEVVIDETKDENVVLMYLEAPVATLLKEIDPSVETYLDEHGRLVVQLKKAQYGLVQSTLLWYKLLRGVLEAGGFASNVHDACVFNKMMNGKQITIAVHVDDL